MIKKIIEQILISSYTTKIDFLKIVYGEVGVETISHYYDLFKDINYIIEHTDFSKIDDKNSLKNLVNLISDKDIESIYGDSTRNQIIDDVYDIKLYETTKLKQISSVQASEKRFYELLDYQYIIKNRVLSIIENDFLSRLIIHMPTGSGKTKTAMHILCSYLTDNLKVQPIVLWLAQSKELIEQAAATLINSWRSLGVGAIDIAISTNPSFEVNSDFTGVVFCTYQKLVSMFKKRDSIYNVLANKCSMVIADEAHHSTAREWKESIEYILKQRHTCLVGLTATPGRADGKDLIDFYDNNLISIDMETAYRIQMNKYQFENSFPSEHKFDPVNELQQQKILSKLVRQVIYFNQFTSEDLGLFVKMKEDETIDKLSKIPERNKIIIDKIVEISNKKLSTIVFSCTNDHAYLIQKLLCLLGIDSHVITSETSNRNREKYIENFKNGTTRILINNRVLTTGFDAPNTECIFITRPTFSMITYSQMIGRGLRGPKVGGNETCLLIDIVDNLLNYSDENSVFKYFEQYWR